MVHTGSSSTAVVITQLAQLAGLKVISIVDQAKHGHQYSRSLDSTSPCRPDIVIDSHNPDRAIHLVREITKGQLYFGIDTRGGETAGLLSKCLSGLEPGLNTSVHGKSTAPNRRSHLVGLTGLPKTSQDENFPVAFHSVPIKLFHEVPSVGGALTLWLERLLELDALRPPQPVGIEEGLEKVNRGLEKMKSEGGRVVVRL